MRMKCGNSHDGKRGRRGYALAIALFSLAVTGLGTFQYVMSRAAAPNQQQKIVARLASWGLSVDRFDTAVTREQVQQRLKALRGPISEKRVQAARWLADRGLRETGPSIAAAMEAPGTFRPCQLAKSLGDLGAEQYTGKLVDAAQQQSNADLRVCATLALGQIQSPKAVDGLISVYKQGFGRGLVLEALARTADPAALSFLQSVKAQADKARHRTLAAKGIERIKLLQRDDPVPGLIQRIERAAADHRANEWAARHLAERSDARAVPALKDAFVKVAPKDSDSDGVILAAALLAHGDPGTTALKSAESRGQAAGGLAEAALAVRPGAATDIERMAGR